MGRVKSGLNVDEVAAVIDKHTGRVRYQCRGLGAGRDARSFLHQCLTTKDPKRKVDFLNSATVITGKEAEKAIRKGRT